MHNLSRRQVLRLALAACVLAAPLPSAGDDALPLAIKGYDPVAYFTLGAAKRGLPEFEYAWDERRYRFATPEHRDLFRADPARYAPQFAGLCAVSLSRGYIVEANPEYWLISDGKLYLFGGPDGPKRFRENLAQNVAKANANRGLIKKR